MRKLVLILLCLLAAPVWSATCVIGEYSALSDTTTGQVVSVATNLLTSQALSNATETDSAAFNASTRYIRLICDSKTHFKIGAGDPDATTNDQWVAADVPEYFGVAAGEKISILTGS